MLVYHLALAAGTAIRWLFRQDRVTLRWALWLYIMLIIMPLYRCNHRLINCIEVHVLID